MEHPKHPVRSPREYERPPKEELPAQVDVDIDEGAPGDAGLGGDETRPRGGEPVPQPETGGETPDRAGEFGPQAVETAKALEEKARRDAR